MLWLLASLGVRLYVTNFGNYTATYGALAGVMILLLWFYVSGICILIGAEMNAEIEHASPHGKAPSEKVAGEEKKIGVLAAREHEERLKRGEQPEAAAAAAGPNCPLETLPKAPVQPAGPRPSEVIVLGSGPVAGRACDWREDPAQADPSAPGRVEAGGADGRAVKGV